MTYGKCPVCGNKKFYVKNPDDEYDIYVFECRDGTICFEEPMADEDGPEISEDTETYCDTCAWHDRFDRLK